MAKDTKKADDGTLDSVCGVNRLSFCDIAMWCYADGKLVVSVEVDSMEKAEQVRKYQPRLTDAFLSDLYGTFSRHAASNGGEIPIPYLKKRLNILSGKVLGEHVVNDVLLQVMQKRQT